MKTRDVVTAASVISDRHMVGLKVEDIKEAMVSAMLEYADLRERKLANGVESKDGKLPIMHVVCSCYLCGTPIPDKKDQYEMYGEKVCKSCCDEQSDFMLRMSGHEY